VVEAIIWADVWGHVENALNAAFLLSWLVLLLGAGVVVLYAKRRPKDAPLTWGEAMVAALFAFFLMFVAYGIMPHQWLTFADNSLHWRKDKTLNGPWGLVGKLPFTVSYEAVRDLVAVLLYVVALGLQMVLWSMWQKRGQEKPKELPTSAYGRPLVKRA